ncbi:hypothetical protein DF185_19900 [Marinifilum breve]|uniref:Terminase n=1 Tax=Marinifilum breve TaxID=2184082 RepID=A0A2V3ZWG0_9BACT|nr:hypothetical protein [Marinifilum breve]PXX96906.1 hypothetical protein DF185_19900 [Marinifilum breve]
MAIKQLTFNPSQLCSITSPAPCKIGVKGRATGKSSEMAWDFNVFNHHMPRGVISVTGSSFAQLLTRTLTPTFGFLERLGYVRDVHYVINQKPPKNWPKPYNAPLSYDNFISFNTGLGAMLISQDRAGSGRGPSIDFEIMDEGLTINKERYDQEVSAANRGNLEYFKHLPWHHGFHYVSSMPFSNTGKWLLEFGEYYETEAGIRLFDEWNQIVRMQIDLLDIEDPHDFKLQWNEIQRRRRKIIPFTSKDGFYFELGNCFDNIHNIGLSYIKRERKKMTHLNFLIEIMNMVMDRVEDCYYNINEEKQIYYDCYDYSYIDSLDYDWKKLGSPDSRFDGDCVANEPIKLVVDWGSNISVMLACQENHRVVKEGRGSFNFLKEFFVKPDVGHVMIDDIIDDFCDYYQYHQDKTVVYYRDKYGDEGQANNSFTYNDQAIDRLQKKGWFVDIKEYAGKEPPHHEKYLLWGNILKEKDPSHPIVRINGNNCKFLLIAMNNTKVVERNNKFKKDKSSEHKNSGVPPEEATHSTDAADKVIWIDYHDVHRPSAGFIPIRF